MKEEISLDAIAEILLELSKLKSQLIVSHLKEIAGIEDHSNVQFLNIIFLTVMAITQGTANAFGKARPEIYGELIPKFEAKTFETIGSMLEGINLNPIVDLYYERNDQYRAIPFDDKFTISVGRVFRESYFPEDEGCLGKDWCVPLMFAIGSVYVNTVKEVNELLQGYESSCEIVE